MLLVLVGGCVLGWRGGAGLASIGDESGGSGWCSVVGERGMGTWRPAAAGWLWRNVVGGEAWAVG